jgi:hypothetical protein
VFDDTVADIYLGPTLTARLRARFSSTDGNGHAPTDSHNERREPPSDGGREVQ